MPHLLCSLGATHAVVIEAILLLQKRLAAQNANAGAAQSGSSGGVHAAPSVTVAADVAGTGSAAAPLAVHIITSTGDANSPTTRSIAALAPFAAAHPEITFDITRVADFENLNSADEQHRFDETLARWYLALAADARATGEPLHVCLAGGFKTMSASVQQTAGWLGADSLFHVIAKPDIPTGAPKRPSREPNSETEIRAALAAGNLHEIPLAAPAGWPQLAALNARDYPLVFENACVLAPVGTGTTPVVGSATTSVANTGTTPAVGTGSAPGASAPAPAVAQSSSSVGVHADTALATAAALPVRLARLPNKNSFALTEHIAELATRSRNISANFQEIAALPFPELAAWPAAQLAWLNAPLDPSAGADQAWVRALPKIDLHLHLGGFATHGDLLRQVRQAAADKTREFRDAPPFPADWPRPATPISLDAYMHLGDATGSALLSDPGCLEKHCELLYEHLREQNVAYAEIRCSPANYAKGPAPLDTPFNVLATIREHFAALMKKHGATAAAGAGNTARTATVGAGNTAPSRPAPFVNLIIIATRKPDAARDYRSDIARHLSLAVTAAEQWRDETAPRVVAVDLAGFEHKETRAHLYKEDFSAIHRTGLALTIHAGENDDAEGIWQAVFTLNTRRIGHALSLENAPDLLRSVADRRIAIEMCPLANYQIKGFAPMPPENDDAATGPHDNIGTGAGTGKSTDTHDNIGTGKSIGTGDNAASTRKIYPLKHYLDAGIPVTLNTDNPGISAANLAENILFAAEMSRADPDVARHLTRLDILRCLKNSINAAFISPATRATLLQTFHIPQPT